MKSRLAVLITCHNRQAKTLECLKKLSQQSLSNTVEIQVYLVDDGSTDGTAEAVKSNYPKVKVIPGNGNLFWNGGTRLAFSEAIKSNYDYYLWLNDDTILYPNALEVLLNNHQSLTGCGYRQVIVAGATQDIKTGVFTYGGMERSNWWHPLKFKAVKPEEYAKPCLTMNGNCVLIPQDVVKVIGNLDSAFTHSTGDVDYGLRNHQNGGSVWLAPGYIGTCEYNPLRQQAWEDPKLNLYERWKKINQPRGLPFKEWKIFSRRYAGFLWAIYWLLPYARLVLKKT
jgi:GT2 family glycosyltransferase